jgi:hypothetical protein
MRIAQFWRHLRGGLEQCGQRFSENLPTSYTGNCIPLDGTLVVASRDPFKA